MKQYKDRNSFRNILLFSFIICFKSVPDLIHFGMERGKKKYWKEVDPGNNFNFEINSEFWYLCHIFWHQINIQSENICCIGCYLPFPLSTKMNTSSEWKEQIEIQPQKQTFSGLTNMTGLCKDYCVVKFVGCQKMCIWSCFFSISCPMLAFRSIPKERGNVM